MDRNHNVSIDLGNHVVTINVKNVHKAIHKALKDVLAIFRTTYANSILSKFPSPGKYSDGSYSDIAGGDNIEV